MTAIEVNVYRVYYGEFGIGDEGRSVVVIADTINRAAVKAREFLEAPTSGRFAPGDAPTFTAVVKIVGVEVP